MSMPAGVAELPERYNIPGRRPIGETSRAPAIDGLRALAIAGVVAFHAGVLPGGFLGVDLFFVLSGFLIAGVLLRERDARALRAAQMREAGARAASARDERDRPIHLTRFWTRRARRLVPAVLLLLAAVQLWARLHPNPAARDVINGQTVAALAYGSNWYNIFRHIGYWDSGTSRSPLNHLWSLAIEEQFYLVFPLVMLALFRLRASKVVLAGVLATLAAVSFALTPWLYAAAGANRAYFGTDARAGAILAGALLAVVLGNVELASASSSETSAKALPAASKSRNGLAATLGACALVCLAPLWWFLTTADARLYNGALALHAAASVAIIAALVLAPATGLARVLAWRPFVYIGERSYALYLWHWPVMVLVTPAVTGLTGLAHTFTVAIVIAIATVVSYELIEHPIHHSYLRGGRLVSALGIPAVAVGASALAFQPTPPPQFGSNALFTTGHGGIGVLIVGDSWARNLGIALAEVDSTHRTSIMNMGKGGCGIADAKRERSPEKGDFDTSPDCLTWHATWRAVIDVSHPDAAILMAGNWDQALQDFEGNGQFVGACSPVFRARYLTQLDAAIDTLNSGGAMVFVATVRDNDERAGSGPDCMNTLLREAVTRRASDRVRILDQYAELCQDHRCPVVADGDAVYDETGHLAPHAQQRIARWVLNTVYAAVGR